MLGAGSDIKIAARVSFVGNDPDMWVNYGGKFDAYCPMPTMEHQIERFGRALAEGDQVQVILHQTEICEHFLGSDSPVSMREGKATFLGLIPERLLN